VAIQAIIVDDEPLARSRLKRLLVEQGVEVPLMGNDGQEAIELVAKTQADILFIDINMPIKNGLQAAQEISQMDKPPAIVFCTAYDEYAIDAFKTNAIAYLLKPVRADDIHDALHKAASLSRLQINQLLVRNEALKTVAVHYQGALQNIPAKQFAYFRSEAKNVFATLINGDEILIDKTLKQLESDLEEEFIRVHRATLINRAQALKLVNQNGQVCVALRSIEVKLPISRRHLAKVKQCFV